ncbi:MAG TPA: hypothetical protein DCQ64_18690 [Candidatus Rokubacteria bacterium]|nr:hypothetical protein [Candidatus Rokubacteria bacterium]
MSDFAVFVLALLAVVVGGAWTFRALMLWSLDGRFDRWRCRRIGHVWEYPVTRGGQPDIRAGLHCARCKEPCGS